MARKFEPGISFGRSAQKLPFPLPESLSPSLSLPLALPPAIPKLNPESSRKANFFGCLKCVDDPNLAFNRHSPRIASHCFTVAYSAPAFWQPLKLLLPSGFGSIGRGLQVRDQASSGQVVSVYVRRSQRCGPLCLLYNITPKQHLDAANLQADINETNYLQRINGELVSYKRSE